MCFYYSCCNISNKTPGFYLIAQSSRLVFTYILLHSNPGLRWRPPAACIIRFTVSIFVGVFFRSVVTNHRCGSMQQSRQSFFSSSRVLLCSSCKSAPCVYMSITHGNILGSNVNKTIENILPTRMC